MNIEFFRNSLGFYLGCAKRSLQKRLIKNISETGVNITPEQWEMLHLLWIKDGRQQNEFTALTDREKTTVTRIINGLEKKGLIKRETNSKDKRGKRIFLTENGAKLENELLPMAQNTLQSAQIGFSEEELTLLKSLLKRVCDNLNEGAQ